MTLDNLPAQNVAPATGHVVNLTEPLTDLEAALRLSDTLSRSSLVPQALLGKPASVFHVLMTGQALGLHWTESIRVIYSAGPGQIGMRGAFLLSRLRQAKHRYSFEEGPDYCTFHLTRGDTNEEFTSTFTVDDAIRGGLLKRQADGSLVALSRDGKPLPWQTWTKRMLRWRSVSDGVSVGAPEVALGFEIEGSEPAPAPEITLKPADPASPEPASTAAAGDAQETQDQLAELDQQMRPADPAMGGNPAPERAPDPADAAKPSIAPAESPGRKALEENLAKQFTEMGWSPAKFRGEMLRACSMFARRRIANVHGLRIEEIMQMSAALSQIAEKHEPEHHVVALADQVDAWREQFAKADPDGYEHLTGSA